MADTKITGTLFQSMVTEGALAITEQKEQINELNVFPVPDGDTGTNMSMTMTAAMNELAKLIHLYGTMVNIFLKYAAT